MSKTDISRRDVLKSAGVAGGTVLTVGALSGTTAAHREAFFGCSQVCADRPWNHAVIATDNGYRCEQIGRPGAGEEESMRNNPAVRDWDEVWCLEVSNDEAIVGTCEPIGGGEFTFVRNPNRCADNYLDNGIDCADLNC